MLIEEIRKMRMGRRDFRQFGISIGIVLGLLGGYLIWKKNDASVYVLAASAILLGAGLFLPDMLKPVYRVWMSFAILMGWVMTRVILVAVYIAICTPIALLARITGKHFLEMSFSTRRDTYWIPKTEADRSRRDYRKQF
jgi:hypothetical protein